MAAAPALRPEDEIRCPECGSESLFRDGFRRLADGSRVQRWLCRKCGYRFSRNHVENSVGKGLKTDPTESLGRRVCAWEGQAKNSARGVVALEEKADAESWAAGATVDLTKTKILEYAWHLQKRGRSAETISSRVRRLRSLAKHCNLLDPNSVEEALAKLNWRRNSKASAVIAYKDFLKFLGVSWEPPGYRMEKSIPFIPLEREIDDLIACSNKRVATLLQILKETGARIGEAARLKWVDFDVERRTLCISSPEKNSEPRIFHISEKLAGMLNSLPRKGEYIFNPNVKALRTAFEKQRGKAAAKLNNPRLLRITFHTLRHWKGTMEYHKTKDPWHVKKVLGHKRLQSTEVYINIEQALFQHPDDEFHVRVAKTPEEIKELLEAGFDYVCEKDGLMFFRKRK